MAIVYSYPQATAQLTDLILGTRITEDGSSTRSFSVADIVTLAGGNVGSGGYVPYIGANANVQLGNHALSLTNGANINTLYPDEITMVDGSNYFSLTASGINFANSISGTFSSLGNDGVLSLLSNLNGAVGYLRTSALTANVTLQYPNKTTGSYTIATTADLVPYKAFTFLTTQTGTTFTNSNITSIANALGTYTGSYVAVGTYRITFVTALATNALSLQTNIIYKTVGGSSYLLVITKPSANIIEIKTYDATSGSLVNGVLSNYIELRSYN